MFDGGQCVIGIGDHDDICSNAGSLLLGLYFFLPEIPEIMGYANTLSYISLYNIPLPEVLLPVTIDLQVVGGLMLMLSLCLGQVALTSRTNTDYQFEDARFLEHVRGY